MTTFRPARRVNTPLIIGLAGPTKSGKTYSAHRLAAGLANGKPVAMINAEGAKGHQYADKFDYLAADLTAPFRPQRYTETLREAMKLNPGVVIIDSCSHFHDGPGGMLEYHEDELDRLAGDKTGRDRDRYNWTAWIKPRAAENEFIYAMLAADAHLILCFRAKEKIKIREGKPPEELGYQPIAGERVAFETIFTLLLPPHSKGVPDLDLSDMREPFDSLIPRGRQLDEDTGRQLAEWAAGAPSSAPGGPRKPEASQPGAESPRPAPRAPAQGLTLEQFHHETAALFITPGEIRACAGELFPGAGSVGNLTDAERGELLAVLADRKANQGQLI